MTAPTPNITRLDAELTRPTARRYTPSAQELVRQAAAAEHLAQVAAERRVSPYDYERHGLDVEWHHQLDDPAVPPLLVRPSLSTGAES